MPYELRVYFRVLAGSYAALPCPPCPCTPSIIIGSSERGIEQLRVEDYCVTFVSISFSGVGKATWLLRVAVASSAILLLVPL